MRFSVKAWFRVIAIGLSTFAAVNVAAQPAANTIQKIEPSSFAGKYEGKVTSDSGEQKIVLDIAEAAGKSSGTLTTARGSFKIIKGQIAEGALTLEIERPGGPPPGAMVLRPNGVNLTATFSDGGKNLTVEFRRVVADDISGEWDAVADTSGQAFPFTLTLKLEGEKVTGSSVSQLGNSNISSGSWKDGKLSVVLEGRSGPITLVATMIEGKLSGDYDFAGQLQGKWVAIRKK